MYKTIIIIMLSIFIMIEARTVLVLQSELDACRTRSNSEFRQVLTALNDLINETLTMSTRSKK